MTVVERIWQLQDELIRLQFAMLAHPTDKERARMAAVEAQLQRIQVMSPLSWKAAKRR